MTRDIDDPDLPLADLFRTFPGTVRVFWRRRMACVGCPIAPFHTVADACRDYGLDEAAFRAELRAAVSEPTPRRRSVPRDGAARTR
ncbi:DUF1858 domain-containing protein [Amaricoccus sp. W119]|uniref:DUF1858 domain-containing protein n=1 Tax=Amaricoccus sp. W119 TaxID=3391833 RepID=UPI0039A718F9